MRTIIAVMFVLYLISIGVDIAELLAKAVIVYAVFLLLMKCLGG